MQYLKRLKDLREDNDLKQEDIAKVLNITRQQYQLYESGKRKLPIDKLIDICEFYNVSADYILGFTKKQSQIFEQKKKINISNNKNTKIGKITIK